MTTGTTSRPAAYPFLEHPLELRSDPLLQQPRVRAFLRRGAFDGLAQDARRVAEHLVVPSVHRQPARNHFRCLLEQARLAVDRDDGNYHPVSGKMPSVSQHLVGDFTGPGPVNQHPSGGNLVGDSPAFAVESDDIAVGCHQHRRVRADEFGHLPVARQLPILPMYRHEVLRLYQ